VPWAIRKRCAACSKSGVVGPEPARAPCHRLYDDADTGEAYAHVRRADEWLRWYRQQDQSARVDMRQNVDDYASIPFYLLAKDRTTNAARFNRPICFRVWIQVVQQLFDLCTVATTLAICRTTQRADQACPVSESARP